MKTLYIVSVTILATLLTLLLLRGCGIELLYYTQVQPRPQIIHPQPSGKGCLYPGEQPLKPTANAVQVKWESIFGPRGPMEVDYETGSEIKHVPTGMMIFWEKKDKHLGWAWTMEGHRVRYAPR